MIRKTSFQFWRTLRHYPDFYTIPADVRIFRRKLATMDAESSPGASQQRLLKSDLSNAAGFGRRCPVSRVCPIAPVCAVFTMASDILQRIREFDAYPKTLEDFRVKTYTGAVGTCFGAASLV